MLNPIISLIKKAIPEENYKKCNISFVLKCWVKSKFSKISFNSLNLWVVQLAGTALRPTAFRPLVALGYSLT